MWKQRICEIISKKHANLLRHCDGGSQDLLGDRADEVDHAGIQLMTGEYGLYDVVLSIPAVVVDANGIEAVVPIELSENRAPGAEKSAEILKGIIKDNV